MTSSDAAQSCVSRHIASYRSHHSESCHIMSCCIWIAAKIALDRLIHSKRQGGDGQLWTGNPVEHVSLTKLRASSVALRRHYLEDGGAVDRYVCEKVSCLALPRKYRGDVVTHGSPLRLRRRVSNTRAMSPQVKSHTCLKCNITVIYNSYTSYTSLTS